MCVNILAKDEKVKMQWKCTKWNSECPTRVAFVLVLASHPFLRELLKGLFFLTKIALVCQMRVMWALAGSCAEIWYWFVVALIYHTLMNCAFLCLITMWDLTWSWIPQCVIVVGTWVNVSWCNRKPWVLLWCSHANMWYLMGWYFRADCWKLLELLVKCVQRLYLLKGCFVNFLICQLTYIPSS